MDPDPRIHTSNLSAYTGTFEGTFTSFFKDKKSNRSHKTVGITVFLAIFA
jgi:hypothetical protein